MANKVIVTKSKLNKIGDTIREKTEEDKRYTLDEMPDVIRSISGGNKGIVTLEMVHFKLSDVDGDDNSIKVEVQEVLSQ